MAELLHAEAVPLLFNVEWRNAPNAVTNFRCRIRVEALLEDTDKNFELA
jgi:hypothetical protein